ncbi:DHH family phosphoesterase [Sulfurimonas sp. ST-25]|uniref:DHH family phosphoesterase n=1 Tax=Sulfurimonas sp. ST-25 TaxID=3400151 RepID=UPI003A8B59FD
MTIYHLSHIDLDGYSCQLVMQHTPHTMHFYNANYGEEVPERLRQIVEAITHESEAMILVTDLNLTPDESRWLDGKVKRFNESGKKITLQLLDHHGSGKESAARYGWYLLDTDRSATKITYEFAKEQGWLQEEPVWMEAYVAVVNAVDLWLQHETENFEYGKVLMRLVSETRELGRTLFAEQDRAYKLSLLTEAAAMIALPDAPIVLDEKIHLMKKGFFRENENNTLDNLVTKYIVSLMGAKRKEMTIYYKGYRGFLSYAVGNTSIIGNGFLVAYPEYDFIVDISPRGTMSLRANNQVDVSLIAKEWAGGGGHPNASGGRIQGFKEQFRYDKVKTQIESLIAKRESVSGKLPQKSE